MSQVEQTSQKAIGWSYQRIINRSDLPMYEELTDNFEAALDVGEAKDINGKVDESLWQITLFFDVSSPRKSIISALEIAEKITNQPPSAIALKPLYEEDWQANMRRNFPPIHIGPVTIYSFEDEEIPADQLGLYIPAGMAFGSGEHATTSLCLDLYLKLDNHKALKNGLDMGAGSGILAITAARLHGVPFLAVDIDEPSVEVCQENAQNNKAADKVRCVCGDGFKTPDVQDGKPYDLIFANILMNPLIEMAPELVKVLAEDGHVILSGFTADQVDDVAAAYQKLGLKVIDNVSKDNWHALRLSR